MEIEDVEFQLLDKKVWYGCIPGITGYPTGVHCVIFSTLYTAESIV